MHWPGHHKTSQNSYLDIIGHQEDQLGICFTLIYFTYGKLSPKIDQYISISLNRRKNNMQRVTCKSLESSHEQQWAGWWRRSVAGAAIAWTAVCAAFSAKRARSEIFFMSSCLHVILIHSMLGRFSQKCPKCAVSDDHDAWLLSVRTPPHNQNPNISKPLPLRLLASSRV